MDIGCATSQPGRASPSAPPAASSPISPRPGTSSSTRTAAATAPRSGPGCHSPRPAAGNGPSARSWPAWPPPAMKRPDNSGRLDRGTAPPARPIDQFCSLLPPIMAPRCAAKRSSTGQAPTSARRSSLRLGYDFARLLPLRLKHSLRRDYRFASEPVVRRRLLCGQPRRSGQRASGAGISRLQRPLCPTSLSVIDRDACAYAQGGASAACLLLPLLVTLASSGVEEVRCFLVLRLVVSPSDQLRRWRI
jgi:hypothetical protein